MNVTRKQIIIVSALLLISFFFVMGTGIIESRQENMKNLVKDIDIKKIEEKRQGLKPQRYMYMSSGIKANSSYDSRGEPVNTPFEPEKTGAFFNSVLNNNYTNDHMLN